MLQRSPHLIAATSILALLSPVTAGDPSGAVRERMVREQIASRGIRNPAVLRVLRATPRHLFLPEAIQANAYEDCALPIGYGGTISQPYIVALMTELLAPEKSHRVLEIGTGSGYQAAVLAQLAWHVYTIELVPELANSARRRLAALGYLNVTVRDGDGYEGWPEHAPFDRIILTAAPEDVPRVLLDELAPGGRLVAPVGIARDQELIVIEKHPDGTLRRSSGVPVLFVPMRTRIPARGDLRNSRSR
ncbi:MAG TPA: protein-L-isoaspartate(D-aspartate) O-methyltransferase [Bryobacteraceae bacterium]|nr:protein-L-isoaspartate(D-aspartate) O-methyltransferase [Bryobacteraceae bacterium]